MSARSEPLVMVISTWREDDGVRARIVHGTGTGGQTLASGSIHDVVHAIGEVIYAWDSTNPQPGEHHAPRNPRDL